MTPEQEYQDMIVNQLIDEILTEEKRQMVDSRYIIRTQHFVDSLQNNVKFTIHGFYRSTTKTFEDKTIVLNIDHETIKEIEKYLGDIKKLKLPYIWGEMGITILEYIKGNK